LPDSAPSTTGAVLVALGPDARTLRLVHAGFRIAREQGRPWVAVHVEVPGLETPEEAGQARVWLQEAQELGAETVWIRSSSIVNGLLAEWRKRQAALLILGKSKGPGRWPILDHTRAQEVLRREPDARVLSLPLDVLPPARRPVRTLADAAGVLAATAVLLTVCGIFASALAEVAGFPAIPAVFAAGVAFVSHRWGRRASIPATLLGTLLYLYFFAEPRFSLAFSDGPRLFYFLGTLVLVQVLVALVDRLKLEARIIRRREAETVLLLLLGRALARCASLGEAAEVIARRFRNIFQAEAWLLVPTPEGAWDRYPEAGPAPPCPPPDRLLAEFGTLSLREDPLEPLVLEGCEYVALASTRGTEGLLQIQRLDGGRFPQDSWGSLQAFAVQGALAIERIRWLETARQAHVDRETERMRSSLLSAISHDLRTPLAAIQGAASSLLLPAEPLPEATRRDMLAMIHDESRRLARLLSNLLDLTRLESGVIRARKEWQPLDEVIGAVLRHLEAGGSPLEVKVDLAEDLLLVPIDAVLFEQLLVNLLVNARRHAPDSPVELKAWAEARTLELSVTDQGPGIPEAYRERIFDKFFRTPGSDGGVGLGLAICDAIARTHGGRIWVESGPTGGAAFRVSLPLEGEPPLPPSELLP
jgi:two-component system sensor histidine kinase KdpD